jgi:DNA replication initiation complex subunit (GINS family)
MITYHELRKIQMKEREDKDLQDLGEGFVDNISSYIAAKEGALADVKGKDSIFSDDAREEIQAELNNAIFIIGDIYERRLRKILNQAMISMKTKDIGDTTKMLEHEIEMYDKITGMLKSFRKNFFDVVVREKVKNAQKRVVQKPGKVPDGKAAQYVVSCDIPSFVWHDSKEYGPFKCNEVVELPADVAGFLVKGGKVKVKRDEDTKKEE